MAFVPKDVFLYRCPCTPKPSMEAWEIRSRNGSCSLSSALVLGRVLLESSGLMAFNLKVPVRLRRYFNFSCISIFGPGGRSQASPAVLGNDFA